MVRALAAVTLSAMTIVALAGSTTYAQPDRASLVITVQVQGQTTVDPRTLFVARADVTTLYRQAGVSLSWVTANADLVIVLAGNRESCAMKASPHTMGQAIVNKTSKTGRLAYVYYDRVEDLAATSGLDTANILGHVMAHEMAHLLGVPHAESGLMRAGWDDAELAFVARGLLSFSPAQSEVVRQGVAAHAAAAAHAESAILR